MLTEISAPDGLTDDVPRAVRFTTSTQLSRLALLLAIVSVACLLARSHDRDLGRMNALKSQGCASLAHVIGKHTSQGKSTSYYLEYDFKANGAWQYGERDVSEDEYEGSRPGAAALVTYLPSRPETFVFGTMTPGRVQQRQDVWLWGEGGASVLFILWVIGMESTFRRHLSLLRGGSVAVSTITERSLGPTQGMFYLTYQFGADGELCSERISITQRFHEQTDLGQALTVLYDPSHPSHSVPYRMLKDVSLE